ncbi:MAG: hydrolase [Smithella sp.]|jgi:nicotinamidase-related amidase|nr:hydrolase [Smithella sp.]
MLSRTAAVLILIDFQGKLAQSMHNKEDLFANTVKLIRGFRALGLPLLITEQTPEKLGTTIPLLALELTDAKPIAKETFSCWANPLFHDQLESLARRQVVLAGIESHVCVYQTALDLMQNGYTVHLVADAVSSRAPENRKIGIKAVKNAGAQITSTEMVLFELLGTAADPQAREIFKIVK